MSELAGDHAPAPTPQVADGKLQRLLIHMPIVTAVILIIMPIATALLTGVATWWVTQSQERTKAIESLRIEVVSEYFSGRTGTDAELATKAAQARSRVLLLANDETAKLLASAGQLGCNRLYSSPEELKRAAEKCGEQFGLILNAYRKELGLRELPAKVVVDALSFADTFAPLVAKAKVEPPPPPLAPHLFMVFFNSDSVDLSTQAHETIKQAADAYKKSGSAIFVAGLTDTDEGDSVALSVRRAGAVKDAFSREGVPVTAIWSTGGGSTNLLVPTGIHVREPQNRRAVISVQ